MNPAALLLHPNDNVLVSRRDIRAGETITVDGESIVVLAAVALGHKIARRRVDAGAKIVKYGMSIGSASCDILPGEWVHLHNLQSDYIAVHTSHSAPRE